MATIKVSVEIIFDMLFPWFWFLDILCINMPRKKKLIDKVAFKKMHGKCHFCEVNDYALLDVHRIKPGEEGGEYLPENSIVSCANCHRKIHDGQIKIDRKYYTSKGKWVLHFWEGEEEKYI